MCIYCESFEDEQEDGSGSEEVTSFEEDSPEQSSNEAERGLRAVITDLI